MRRLLKPLVFLFVTAQLLLAVPAMAAAASSPATAAAQASHCEDMAGGNPPDKCPCCPDADSMKGCFTGCLVVTAIPSQVSLPVLSPARASIIPAAPSFGTAASEPPLKPPPIV